MHKHVDTQTHRQKQDFEHIVATQTSRNCCQAQSELSKNKKESAFAHIPNTSMPQNNHQAKWAVQVGATS